MAYRLISSKNFDKVRAEIKENANKKIVFYSTDDDLNRKVLEKENISMLLLSQSGRKDRMKQRNSGLNSVLAKIAKKKGVKIGIILDEIIDSSSKNKAEILARVMQNIKLCAKNKLRMEFFSVDRKYARNVYDLKALGLVLGMPTWMTKEFN